MNSIRFLLALPAVTLTIAAQTAPAPQLPDRPAVAMTRYKDNWLPIVGADANAPIVVANSNPVTVSASAGIVLSVGDRYASGFVKIEDVYASDVPVTNDPVTAASNPNEFKVTAVDLKAKLTPDVDIPDAYALLIAYPPDQDANSQPKLAVMVHKIGDLTAGKQTSMSARLPKLGQDEGPGWSILVFDAGRQVRSTGMGELLPGYFDRTDLISLKKRIADRVAKGADAPIAVFRQMPFSLPEAVRAKYHGTTIKVEVRAGADGHVVWARPVGLSDADLVDALNKGFGAWLFLPPVKDATAIPGSAIIPIPLK
ncbi:MAG TPA: hypothetical protein VKG78_10355 [Opitutaceae bacterium]|nr:hypothetical protein [Opitutaceae bacterium]